MDLETTQTVLLDDGRFAQVTFAPASRGRIRVLRILVSDEEDPAEESAWQQVPVRSFERDELKTILSQLDMSEVDVGFYLKG